MFTKLPPFAKNFYFVVGVSFLIFMLFISNSDLITQFKLGNKLNTLEKEKAYYLEKIEEVKTDREELFGNKDMLEKFAREKYLMKKSTEDIYVVVEKTE